MRRMFTIILFIMPWLWIVSCNDRKGTAGDQKEEKHPAAHQHSDSTSEMADMPGMDMPDARPEHRVDSALLTVVAAANKVVMSDQASVPVRLLDTVIQVKGYGYITWDVRRNRNVAVRTGGRIEQLWVKYQYQHVQKGQKILELYTPELNTYADEYMHHLGTPGDEELARKSKEKLKLLGLTDQQVHDLGKTGVVNTRIAVYSPAGGYVVYQQGGVPAMGMKEQSPSVDEMGEGMNSNPSQTYFEGASGAGPLREGMYVNRGQTLFGVNDFEVAWGVLSFDEAIQPLLRKGLNVVVKSELMEESMRSTLSFIELAFNNVQQKFIQVRVYLPNTKGKLRINSLIEGRVDVPLHGQLVIPSSAVFSLGKRSVVWVKTGTTPSGKNVFTARDIKVSPIDKNSVVILSGLSAGEQVAADAGYLLDSQSLIEQ